MASHLANETISNFSSLLLFGLLGIGPVLLFRDNLRFAALASPLAGLLFWNIATLGMYFVFYIPHDRAALWAMGASAATSFFLGWTHRQFLRGADTILSLVLFAFLAVCFSWLSNAATVLNGSPSILYFHGTDHLGYANVADWMRGHIAWPGIGTPFSAGPRADPAYPFESMPNIMLNSESRNGAFGYLALIGFIRQLPSTFAYDPACAVFLPAAIVGVAAAFSKSWPTFALLSLGYGFSSWYEFSHTGYLGKMLAYPATLFALGLFFAARKSDDLRLLLVTAIICAGSALLLAGVLTAAILFMLAGPVLILSFVSERRIDWNQISRLGLCCFVSVLAGGYFVHPVNGWVPGTAFALDFVAPRALDIEGWTAGTGIADAGIHMMVALAILTVLGANLLLLQFSNRGELLQTTGLLYPAMLCGLGVLLTETSMSGNRVLFGVAFLLGVLTVSLRLPHSIASIKRYGLPEVAQLAYTKEEIDLIADAVGQQTVTVDTGRSPNPAIVMLVELGRRGISHQWTAETWSVTIAAWRGWPLPTYSSVADLRLVTTEAKGESGAIFVGPKFALLRN